MIRDVHRSFLKKTLQEQMESLPICSVSLTGTESWRVGLEITWITKQNLSFFSSIRSLVRGVQASLSLYSYQGRMGPTSSDCLQVLPIILHCFWIKETLILTARCLQLWPSPFSLGNHFDKHHFRQFPWLSQLQKEARWTACHVLFSPLHWAHFQHSLSISCHSSNQDMIYIVLKKKKKMT